MKPIWYFLSFKTAFGTFSFQNEYKKWHTYCDHYFHILLAATSCVVKNWIERVIVTSDCSVNVTFNTFKNQESRIKYLDIVKPSQGWLNGNTPSVFEIFGQKKGVSNCFRPPWLEFSKKCYSSWVVRAKGQLRNNCPTQFTKIRNEMFLPYVSVCINHYSFHHIFSIVQSISLTRRKRHNFLGKSWRELAGAGRCWFSMATGGGVVIRHDDNFGYLWGRLWENHIQTRGRSRRKHTERLM